MKSEKDQRCKNTFSKEGEFSELCQETSLLRPGCERLRESKAFSGKREG